MSLKDEVEHFLFEEAQLLDTWKLREWESLFTDDGEFHIPPLNCENPETIHPRDALFLLSDDRRTLAGRVERMMKKTAYVETPRSNIRHFITNIRILSEIDGTIRVASNFMVYRTRRGLVSNYIGQYFHTLIRDGGGFKIRERRACLDLDLLQPQGSIGIII